VAASPRAVMTISPVALTLIGTGAGLLGAVIGTVGTLWSASLTQRATRDRESTFKVWERRADAIEEAHRATLPGPDGRCPAASALKVSTQVTRTTSSGWSSPS
jgi:hypothetical protein